MKTSVAPPGQCVLSGTASTGSASGDFVTAPLHPWLHSDAPAGALQRPELLPIDPRKMTDMTGTFRFPRTPSKSGHVPGLMETMPAVAEFVG